MKCTLYRFINEKVKKYFLFDEEDEDEIGAECIKGKLPVPDHKEKLDEVYYFFDCSKYSIKFE